MYEDFPGEVKSFFGRRIMFPNKKEFSSARVHGAAGSKGYSWFLGTAFHSGIAGSFGFSAVPLQKVGSW